MTPNSTNELIPDEFENIHENKFYLSLLPKIKHEDYQGTDLCTKCHKTVAKNHQAISCDDCEKWTHRACTNISQNMYRTLKTKSYFIFFCDKCNTQQIKFHEDFIKTLQPNDMPEFPEYIVSEKDNLLIICINCRSLYNKEMDLSRIIEITKAHIICLTETWFDGSVPKSTCVPNGYRIFRKDRSEKFLEEYNKQHGGGVAILYKNNLKLELKQSLMDDTEEMLWVKVKTPNSFLLSVIYRPIYSKLLNEDYNLEEKIQQAISISKNIIITEDFNIDLSDPIPPNIDKLKKHINI